ncbi:hypothetical protein [uncultured Microbulbifer sp.]|uniref:hypothetical protein n=1 Tax=uncultured Microbulbifer sp. TaxID=348147 RepID=UPI0025EAE39B|nr:hypothetical protein [uncultured Microbulbifer sp.]
MKKLYPLIALLVVTVIAGLYGLNHYSNLRAQQREQVSYLLSRCVNQSLLSMFRLQANNWQARPDFYRQEADALTAEVTALPEKILDGKPFDAWREAVSMCEQLTENSNRQHRTIFRPLGHMASTGLWGNEGLKEARMLKRRKRVIDQVQVAAQAADSYLKDIRSDIRGLLQHSKLSTETREMVATELEQTVLAGYRRGQFSRREVERYLERQAHFYQLLADNTRGFTLRGGSLYFYNGELRRQVEELNRALVTGKTDFYNHWQQVLTRQRG